MWSVVNFRFGFVWNNVFCGDVRDEMAQRANYKSPNGHIIFCSKHLGLDPNISGNATDMNVLRMIVLLRHAPMISA